MKIILIVLIFSLILVCAIGSIVPNYERKIGEIRKRKVIKKGLEKKGENKKL